MNKFTKAACTMVLISFLSGCYPSEQRTKPTDNESIQSFVGGSSISPEDPYTNSKQDVEVSNIDSQALHLNTDNLLLDMNVPASSPNTVSSLKLTLKKWDVQHMKEVLLEGGTIIESYENECQFYPGEKHYSFDTDKLSVFWEPGKFGFDDKTALGGEFKYGSVYYGVTDDFAANDEELSAFTRNDAVKRVNDFLEKIGIENYGEPRITPIKAEFANNSLSEFKTHAEENGELFDYTPWTEKEECYYLRYPLIYNNMELSVDMIEIPRREWGITGTYIEAVVSKDKIIRIRGNEIYSENIEKENEILIKYNFDKALELLKNYYSKLAFDRPTTYYNCKLIYFPYDVSDNHMTVTFMPAWRFSGCYHYYFDETQPDKKRQQNQYFYADSGYRYIGLE